MIEKEQVLNIAKLANLKLTEEEVQNFTLQLGAIIGFIDQINSAPISDIEPTCFIGPSHDPLRDDSHEPSLRREEVFFNAPNVKKGHFAVPRVINTETHAKK